MSFLNKTTNNSPKMSNVQSENSAPQPDLGELHASKTAEEVEKIRLMRQFYALTNFKRSIDSGEYRLRYMLSCFINLISLLLLD